MDWVRVAKALDKEWQNRKQVAEMRPNDADAWRNLLLAHAAFMLRDCLVAGMSAGERLRMDSEDT